MVPFWKKDILKSTGEKVAFISTVVVMALIAGAYIRFCEPFSTLSVENDVIWAKKVADGGYVLHFRHANREKWHDVTAFDAIELLNNYKPADVPFKRATCLSDQGVSEAKLVGDVFKAANVQIGYVASSPSCRAKQTAQYAFGRIDEINNSILHRTAQPERQHKAFNEEMRRMILSFKPAPGKNVAISGHVGTLRLDGGIIIDKNETHEGLDDRQETGFVVLEVVNDKIIARYKFESIKDFAQAALELPVQRQVKDTAQTF
ncbi:MAG: hypothetical protein V4691_01830 [Pseudomonadota bacterium]